VLWRFETFQKISIVVFFDKNLQSIE